MSDGGGNDAMVFVVAMIFGVAVIVLTLYLAGLIPM